jgi:hypothetical protein
MYRILLAGLVAFVPLTAPSAWGDSATVFAPQVSDFAITFSDKPAINEFDTVTAEGNTINGVRAELRAPDSFQRVEVIAMAPGFSSAETKESAIAKMREYAQHNGLRAPEFTWEVTPLGKKLSMRATKILDDNGKARAITFEAIVYYGHSSLFTVYVGGSSESYPPTRVVKFLKSVKKKEKR